jgi:hypothetical protein
VSDLLEAAEYFQIEDLKKVSTKLLLDQGGFVQHSVVCTVTLMTWFWVTEAIFLIRIISIKHQKVVFLI